MCRLLLYLRSNLCNCTSSSEPYQTLCITVANVCMALGQAEEFGRHFRTVMYPRYGPAGGGLLRLHSTYRHDLKIYSSDEGRVQMSAAAFTQAR